MTGKLEGKVAFITGAARGQGRSHALRLASEGADIIAVDICRQIDTIPYPLATTEDLQETARAVRDLGRRIEVFQADVRNFEELNEAASKGVASLGRIDIVIANAGIASATTGTLSLSEQEWGDTIDVNLSGAWRTCKVVVPYIIEGNRGGSVAIISSAAGLRGYPNVGHYVSAKHGLVGLMRTLALELAPHFIRVNSIHPTQVDTMMIQNPEFYRIFEPDAANPTRESFAVASQTTQALPIPWLEPNDVSSAVLYLVSDDGRYVTGVALPVDGGCVIK